MKIKAPVVHLKFLLRCDKNHFPGEDLYKKTSNNTTHSGSSQLERSDLKLLTYNANFKYQGVLIKENFT